MVKNGRNSVKTQWYRIHQGRPYQDVGLGIRDSRGRSMIFGPRLEPNHHLIEYLSQGDDDDFIQTYFCIKVDEEEIPCTLCGGCEERTFACSEDYEEALIESERMEE